jgi:small subunit ribosomal protein S4|tara:strand:- start:519 stop:1244 length:726 start_codon:yes stop_codon:yes gene_type:complete
MGDPRKARKKYRTPSHPWQKVRLDEESKLAVDYGLKNKKEIWKMNSFLDSATNQSKKLVTLMGKQAEKEKENLIQKLKSLLLLKADQGFEEILNLKVEDVLARRLQTLVHRKGMAKSMKQARQMIIHGHILISGKKVTSPAYLVNAEEEKSISYVAKSPFASADHPERIIEEKAPVKKKVEEKKDDKESKSDKKEKPVKKELKAEKKEEKPAKKEAKSKEEKPAKKEEKVEKKEVKKEAKK